MKRVIVATASLGRHIRGVCPRCDTLLSIVLRRSGLMWWHCNTLDCGYKLRFKGGRRESTACKP